jgi:murein endopeptidase
LRLSVFALAAALMAAGCSPTAPRGPERSPPPNAAGLVPMPCRAANPKPMSPFYCLLNRHFMTPTGRDVVVKAAQVVTAQYPGAVVLFMDASGPDGHRPFKPHLSHGDGREIDLALFYTDRAGHPLPHPPTLNGYGANEPPQPGDTPICVGVKGARVPDPPANRTWRLDEARTKALVLAVIADPRVRRVFLEPHLKRRLGLGAYDKVRFQGCWAARHDDHLHVDMR